MGNIQPRTTNNQHPISAPAGGSQPLDVGCFLILNFGPGEAAFNMAMDEALLEAMPRLRQPVLRFYGWTEPAATFGYFQKFADVERTTVLRPLVRRPTGGGLVPHDGDWTYSLTFPPDHAWYSLRAEESYRRAHAWVQAAFRQLGVMTELASCGKKSVPGQCFVGHEKFDLLWRGRKIAGAAQRRNKSGLLIQGSVQPPPVGVSRSAWEAAMPAAVSGAKPWLPDAPLTRRATELTAQKYSQPDFNQRR